MALFTFTWEQHNLEDVVQITQSIKENMSIDWDLRDLARAKVGLL